MKSKTAFYPSSLPVINAVTLVAHGLNQKPEAMMALVNWLSKQGSSVYLIWLSGHHSPEDNIGVVTRTDWKSDMLAGYELARTASDKHSVPLYFVGYSLGALLAQTMIVSVWKDAAFDKQVLLSPAIAIRRRSYSLKLLFLFGLQRKLRSYAPAEHRVHKSLPLLVYKLLFAEEKEWLKPNVGKARIPTLIVIDPKDEMISYRRLLKHINLHALSNVRVMSIKSSRFHHLIIDAHSMGDDNWNRVTKELAVFLFNK